MLGALALPTFALALGISVLTTYAPLLLGEATSSAGAIGLAIGAEGAFALFLPLVIGSLSDRTRTRLGRRIPYALVGAPLLVAPLVILPFAHGYAETVALVSLFFVGYFVYYPPYQAMFAELVPATHTGRAVGIQGVARGLGLGAALVGGGFLLSAWAPLPFLLGAAAVVLTTFALLRGTPRVAAPVAAPGAARGQSVRALLRSRPDIRAFAAANLLWEMSFMGLKTFIVLYVLKGLGESMTTATAVIGVVAGSYVVAALVAGRLADRVGLMRLLKVSIWIYGAGLLFAATLHDLGPMLVALPVVALAGAVLMTLPYGILMRISPAGSEGAVSGLFNLSRAVGVIAGPVVVGLAIDLGAPFFSATAGYGAMWVAVGLPIVLSLAFLPAIAGERAEAAEPETTVAALDELALSA